MMTERDSAENQLNDYTNFSIEQGIGHEIITTAHGAPIGIKTAAQTVGWNGPILLQDHHFLDEISHFDRERIPERVVHAKGAGAFGYFRVTHDITEYCAAELFDTVGKRTPIAVRFSTVGGESGSADTVRDPRGFAIKFYTKDGVWDLVGNNTPIFFINDPMMFPSFIHSQKRNPQTHLKDPDMFWDFLTLRPETIHQTLLLFSDRGIPNGYRHMHGYGSHTFKLINSNSEPVYCKFHFKTDQGIRNLDTNKALELSASDPDYAIRDLFNAIGSNDYPSWTFYIQVMTLQEAEELPYDPFDLTKVWSQKEFPLIPVGQLVLDRNPANYFAEVEQIAFSPAHMVPGIEPSPDKMLQGRLFSYSDTHRYRLGPNYLQIPVNCPYRATVKNFQRDGPMTLDDNQGGAPNYFPNSFSGPVESINTRQLNLPISVSGDISRYSNTDNDYFSQAIDFYENVLTDAERHRLIENIARHLCDASEFIQRRASKIFRKISSDFEEELIEDFKAALESPI